MCPYTAVQNEYTTPTFGLDSSKKNTTQSQCGQVQEKAAKRHMFSSQQPKVHTRMPERTHQPQQFGKLKDNMEGLGCMKTFGSKKRN